MQLIAQLLFHCLIQEGIFPVNYAHQKYWLQATSKQQILWPTQTTGKIYYRKLPFRPFATVSVQPRNFVMQYFRQLTSCLRQIIDTDSLTFGVLTDTHIKLAQSKSYYGLNGLQHLHEFLALQQFLPFDFMVHLGDVIDGSQSAMIDQQLLKQVQQGFIQQKLPYFIAKGNHDDNDKYDEHTKTKRPSFVANTFAQLMWQDMYHQPQLQYVSNKWGVGYFAKGQMRILFINTTDVPYQLDASGRKKYDSKLVLAVRNAQLQEIVQILKSSCNKKIIVCGHGNLMTRKGFNALQYNGKAVHDIFKAFNQGLKGHLNHQAKDANFNLDIDFDFSGNQTGRVVAYLCGHRHIEDQFKIDGIQYILLNVSALMGKNHALTTQYNRTWNRQLNAVSEFAGYIININQAMTQLNIFGYGAASSWRKFKI